MQLQITCVKIVKPTVYTASARYVMLSNKPCYAASALTFLSQYCALLETHNRIVDKANVKSKLITCYISCADLQPEFCGCVGNNIAVLQERDICDGRIASSGRTD